VYTYIYIYLSVLREEPAKIRCVVWKIDHFFRKNRFLDFKNQVFQEFFWENIKKLRNIPFYVENKIPFNFFRTLERLMLYAMLPVL